MHRLAEWPVIDRFLGAEESQRAHQTLQKLARHDLSRCALAGGLAVEIHCLRGGQPASLRRLNDIDFVVAAFDSVPATLAADFLFRHVHPLDPPGKTLMQCVDAETRLRVDVFRAYGETMKRTLTVDLPSGHMRIVSLEDALARSARLLMDLRAGVPAFAKHAGDYLRLAKLAPPFAIEAAWRDHRRLDDPPTFREAEAIVQHAITTRPDLLITPQFSQDIRLVCPRCTGTERFPLADPGLILSLLGYC